MSDLIERQAAIDALIAEGRNVDSRYLESERIIQESDAVEVISLLPSVQPERKKGKWINGTCNQCGSHAPYWSMASTYYESNFCPNCGANMRGEKDERSYKQT